MNIQGLRRFENVEFIVPGGFAGNQIKFPDIPLLRSDVEKDIAITGIKVYPAEVVPTTYQQNPNSTTADLQKLFMSLYVSGENSINNIPLPDMITQYFSANTTEAMWVREQKLFDYIQVDWTKSFIQFAASLENEDDVSILFGIEYFYFPPGTMMLVRARRAQANSIGLIA